MGAKKEKEKGTPVAAAVITPHNINATNAHARPPRKPKAVSFGCTDTKKGPEKTEQRKLDTINRDTSGTW